jgi:hypothetical protein
VRTRGEVLADAISFALIRARKIVRGLKQGLTEVDRHAVANDAVHELKRHGDPWKLNEEFPTHRHEGYCSDDWCRPKATEPERDS